MNVLKSFERLITIVHEKNLAARGGGAAGGAKGAGTSAGGGNTLKLDEGNVRGEGASAAADSSGSCGC